ncbi:helix-turn-helix transcriptional regulator [Halosquirtibacter laminarini]|uniref:Helix-turn-helix transcriptional regulator n=1 Tax=Halosquirtibacter laminarini TaxID=3374600 RepID=A0AC61NDQ4_9BACT|nr:helix-turn-helix transcriptional regulator [Prolixibacteraceae bacterium]
MQVQVKLNMKVYYCFGDYINIAKALREAVFVITPWGEILYCNSYGIHMFGYDSLEHIRNFRVKDLVPDEFAVYFPNEISDEHLTNNEYLDRVNKKFEGTEFGSYVKTIKIVIDNTIYIETRVRYRDVVDESNLSRDKLEQQVQLLSCELNAERNRLIRFVGNKEMKYWDHILVRKLLNYEPTLSESECKLASMIYHNFNSHEIAQNLNIATDSVYTARKRLRKKISVPQGDDLKSFLWKISQNRL